ncbi:unnamed protein product [Alopecurus aequalis]
MMQMEKLVLVQQQQRDMQLMKTAMLKHEETFRQQVHDLHRLYRIQKQLMSDLARRPSTVLLPRQHQQGQRRRHQSRRSHIVGGGACTGRQVTPPSRDSEDELELTLAVGSGGGRKQRKRWDWESSPPSSSTDSGGTVQHHQRATACDLREGVMAKQPQWLLQCLSLRMA